MAAAAGFAGLAFFEKYLLGYGIGTAAGPSLEPFVQRLANLAWEANQVRPLDPHDAAAFVAKSIPVGFDVAQQAAYLGIDGTRFAGLVQLARQYPGVSDGLELLRRDPTLADSVKGWLNRNGYSDEVAAQLMKLQHARLSPADMANAVQQGFVPPAGLLPGDVGGPPFDVPVEQVPLPTLAEFADFGIDPDRAKVLAELSGLPPGPVELSQMVLRSQITPDTFFHGIREGHTKTKWGSALLYYLTHPILSAVEYATLHLKGWISQKAMEDGGALSGYSPTQMNLLYLARGRPAAPGQMAAAVARGIDGPDGRPMDEPQFLKGVRESDIRPEWGPMLWGIRFAYPPLFQINRLVQANAIDAATAVEWAKKDRYAPEVVSALAAYWGGGTTAAPTDPAVKSAHTRALTLLRNAYVARRVDDAFATDKLTALKVAGSVQTELLDAWRIMQTIPGAGLTRAQVKKAFKSLPAEWPRDRALIELEDLGMEPEEAQTFLDE